MVLEERETAIELARAWTVTALNARSLPWWRVLICILELAGGQGPRGGVEIPSVPDALVDPSTIHAAI